MFNRNLKFLKKLDSVRQYCCKVRSLVVLSVLVFALVLVYREDLKYITRGIVRAKTRGNWKRTDDVIVIPKGHYPHRNAAKDMTTAHVQVTWGAENRIKKSGNQGKQKKGKVIPFSIQGRKDFYEEQKREQCGTQWQDRYVKLHKDVLSKRKPPRYLIYLCGGKGFGCGGYGNRLSAISSLLLLAILTDRAFLIDWNYSIKLKDFLLPKNIQWDYTASSLRHLGSQRDFWGAGALKHQSEEVRRPVRDRVNLSNWAKETDFRAYFTQPVIKATTMWYFANALIANRYLASEAEKQGFTGFRRMSWIGCAFDFLFRKSKLLEMRLKEARKLVGLDTGIPVMGIHIRVGDLAFGKSIKRGKGSLRTKDINQIIQCANATEKAIQIANTGNMRRPIIWFLASDDARLKLDLARRFPAIKMLNNKIEHIAYFRAKKNLPSKEGMIGVLLDHFLLSECDFLVLSRSSFGTTALGLTFHSKETFSMGFRCKY